MNTEQNKSAKQLMLEAKRISRSEESALCALMIVLLCKENCIVILQKPLKQTKKTTQFHHVLSIIHNGIEIFNLEQIETKDLTYISNSREIAILKNILTELEEIKNNIDSYPIDILEIDIKNIWNELGNIIGEIDDSELIDYMFKNFCLGK